MSPDRPNPLSILRLLAGLLPGFLPSLLAVFFSLCSAVHAADVEKLVVISNDEVVGTLEATQEATQQGQQVQVSYAVDNNGRGPKINETIVLDEQGFPLSWEISGSSLFGAEVAESYRWEDGTATWKSQADSGSVAVAEPAMYIGADSSPWALGMYVRALLGDADQQLDVLPSGHMKLQTLATLEIGEPALPVTIYELSGIQMDPQLLALDADKKLFASFGGRGGLVRAGFEDSLARLQQWAQDYELQRLQQIQSDLAHEYEAPIRYRNVRVFDSVNRTLGEPASVLVSDGRIVAIEAADAGGNPQEVVVDGEGGTLVPGLFDMHSHASMDNGLYYLAVGVTSTRDMGNDNEMLAEIRRAIAAGELAGPRITADGLIEARSPYSARIGVVADDLEEALEAVRWYAANDYFEIKTYNSMNPDWVVPLVNEARKLGLGVTGHVPAFMSPDAVIEAGYDSIAHINQLMLGWLLTPEEDTRTPLRLTGMKRAANLDLDTAPVQKTVRLMQQHGTALDTTAVILERLMLSRAGETPPGDAAYLSHMPIGYQRYRKRTFVPLPEPGDDAEYQAAFGTLLQTMKLLHDSNVRLLPGTDDGTGFTVQRELELYVKAGIPAADTLAMATLGAAEYLETSDEVGSIEPGKHADFLLVDGNPLEDISAIRQVRLVSRGNVIYFPAEIYTALGIEPFAPPAKVSVPAPSWFDPTRVDDAPIAPVVRTQHAGTFNGQEITYDVIAGELLLGGEDGEPAATMFSTAYVRTDLGKQPNRPVMFLFNGGPGASSSPLHLGIGPMRRPEQKEGESTEEALVVNPVSPIDATDMVFVDPVGTGFTRLLKPDAGEQFWGIESDANSVLLLIKTWLEQNDRKDSPVFIMGESYGGTRAAAVAGQAEEVVISGVLLLSPALDFSAGARVVGNNLPYIFLLPSMAATAAYHGVVDPAGRSFLEVFNAAAEYAQSDYAAALYQGHDISAEEKQEVASRLSGMIGLDESFILQRNLRIGSDEFMDELLAAEGLRVGRLDTRAKGLLEEYKDKRPPGNDPSMSGKSSGGRSTGEVLDEYFAERLGVEIDRPYRTLNLDLNQKWDYGQKSGQLKTYFSVVPQLQEAMQRDPDLRVFVGGGVFDIGTPIMAARYATNQVDASPDRFMFAGYEGGHTTFEHEPSRIALCNDIRTFIATTIERAANGAE